MSEPEAPVEEVEAGEAAPEGAPEGEHKSKEALRNASSGRIEPLISRENVAAPPIDHVVKKTRRDFFICCGLLILFTAICLAGVIVLKIGVFESSDKKVLLGARRKIVEHGVANME